jgi:hypothetical protein
MKTKLIALTLPALLVLGACDDKNAAPMPAATPSNPQTALGKSAKTARDVAGAVGAASQAAAAAADQAAKDPNAVIASGMVFRPGAGWERLQPSSMRAAEFKVNGPEGEGRVVFFTGIGGSIQDNLTRWKGQVRPDAGGEPRTSELTIAQAYKAYRVVQQGTYTGMAAGGTAAAPAANTRFIGVIIDGPRGQIQIRFTGPASTVEAAEKAFDDMINGASEQ